MPNLNALAPTTDINTMVEFVNNHGAGMMNPEVFYSKQLLDTIRLGADQYNYYRYAEAAPIQERADKLVLRRWAPLQAHIVPLTEGVPPKSDKGSVEKYELQAHQYGRYMEFTDKVDFKAVDPVVAHYSSEYAIVAVETLDLLAQKELMRVAQKHFSGTGVTTMADMRIATGKPAIADLRLIGLTLKKSLVKPRSNGKFHVLCSPEFVYDMLDDEYVQKFMEYNNTTNPMYENGTLVPMFGFEFYEVMNCPESSEYVNASGKKCIVVYKPYASGAKKLDGTTFAETDADASGYVYDILVESDAAYDPSTNTTGTWTAGSGYVLDSRTNQNASYIPDKFEWVVPEGWSKLKVQHTIILGKDALLRTGLTGEDNAKMYVKPLGSSGVLDPIDQRQSIGFKINSVGFGSVRTEAVVDYVNIPTQLNA